MILLGLDPGLGTTGWGLIAADGNRLTHIGNGQIKTDADMALATRLLAIDLALTDLILEHRPDGAAVEEVFVNVNPQSTLKLGQARGVVLLAASRSGMEVCGSLIHPSFPLFPMLMETISPTGIRW